MDKIPTLLLDREQFQAWKDHPVTVEFFQYLRARQWALMQAWGRGQIWSPEQQAQAVLLGQLAEISLADVAEQYDVEVSDGSDQPQRA
jgi:hypothetical protein